MARPLRTISPFAQALWDATVRAYDAGDVTIDELMAQLGFGRATIFARLAEARQRREDAEMLARSVKAFEDAFGSLEQSSPSSPRDKYGDEPDNPAALLLVIADDVRDVTRLRRNYEKDDVIGEPDLVLRPRFDLESGKVYDREGEDISKTNQAVLVPARRKLRFKRLQSGLPAIDVGPTKTPEDDGLAGGTDTPADPQAREWKIETPELIVTVQAKTKREAKREGKAALNIPMSEPFPKGTRIRAVG